MCIELMGAEGWRDVAASLISVERMRMQEREAIPFGWVLAAILTVTLLFNGIALSLPV